MTGVSRHAVEPEEIQAQSIHNDKMASLSTRHGGTIEVQSEVGVGTDFIVKIPLDQ